MFEQYRTAVWVQVCVVEVIKTTTGNRTRADNSSAISGVIKNTASRQSHLLHRVQLSLKAVSSGSWQTSIGKVFHSLEVLYFRLHLMTINGYYINPFALGSVEGAGSENQAL